MVFCASCKRGLHHCKLDLPSNTFFWARNEVLHDAWDFFCQPTLHKSSPFKRRSSSTALPTKSTLSHLQQPRFYHRRVVAYVGDGGASSRQGQWRRGSSVPGPLEARKRQSLRKSMMEIATSRGSNGHVNVGALLGPGKTKPPEIPKDRGHGDMEVLTCICLSRLQETNLIGT